MFYEMGLKMYEEQRVEEAINAFQKALEDPEEERIGACYYLAQCCKDTQKEGAEKYLLQAMRYGDPSPEICCELGMYYMENKQYEQAIPLFMYASMRTKKQASVFFIKNYWDFVPYLELSVCYDHLGEREQAYHYHKLAGNIYPNAPAILYNEKYYRSLKWAEFQKDGEKEKQVIRERRKKYEKVELPGISMVIVTNKKKYIHTIYENYERIQYGKKELVLILNSNELRVSEIRNQFSGDPDIQVFQLDEEITLGECLNFGISKAKYEYIAKIDDDDYYGANYLLDAMIESKELLADVIIKSTGFIYFEQSEKLYVLETGDEYKSVSGGLGGTIFAKKSVFDQCKFPDKNVAEDTGFLKACSDQGIAVYSGDKFNYIYKRHKSQSEHTWVTSDEIIMGYSIPIDCDIEIEELISC